MRQAFALALVSVVALNAMCNGRAHAAALCQSTKIRPGAFNLTVNNGDTTVVKVTGFKGTKPAPAPSPDVNVRIKAGVPYTLAAGDAKAPATKIEIASNLTANIVVEASPKPPDSKSDDASPQPHPGGPDDKLVATMKDERYASFTESPAPSPSAAAGDGAAPVVEYKIKGEHPGDTALVIAQGDECVALAIHVKPPVGDRFVASAGVAMSFVPKYVITATPAPIGTGTLVYKTENSGHRAAIPLLFNYRLTEGTRTNLYATVGLFTNGPGSGPVYGISVAREQALLTFGFHSENITDFAPGVANNQIVPAGMNTSVTRRVTSPFIALTFPTSFLTQLLSGTTSSGSGSSNTTGSK